MNKKIKITLLVIGTILLGGIAFVIYEMRKHTSDSHLSCIPQNAAGVLKINIKQLAVKADPMKLMSLPGFKNSGSTTLNELVSDPFATGIDPVENVYGFICAEENTTVAAIVFNVDDADKLNQFENKLHLSISETTIENGIYYAPISETECLAWNNDAGIILATKDGEAKPLAIKYLNQTSANCISQNSDYNSFAEKTFDIGLFFNNKELSKMTGTEKTFSSIGFNEGHGEALLNFENDKISTSYTNYTNDQAKNILRKTGPDIKQFSAIAPTSPLVYLGIAADMNELFTVMKNDPSLSTDLAGIEMGFGIGEAQLKKLFTGDISFSFTDFKDISTYDPRIKANIEKMVKAENVDPAIYALNVPMCYVSIGVSDELKMKELLLNSGMAKVDSFYAMPGLSYIVYVAVKDGHFLVTNDYFAAQQLSLSGKFTTSLPSEISKTEPLSAFADLNQTHFPASLTNTLKTIYGDEGLEIMLNALHPFQNVKMSGKENGSQVDISIEPGEGNSLYRLLAYYSTMMN